MTRAWAGLRASVGRFLYRRTGHLPIRRCTEVVVLHDFRGHPRCPDCGFEGIAQSDGQDDG